MAVEPTDLGTMTRGERRYIDLTIRDGDENLVNLDNRTLVLTAKRSKDFTDAEAIFRLVSNAGITHAADQSGAGKGLATAEITPELTKDLNIPTYGQPYVLDAWVADVPNAGGEYYLTINYPVARTLP